MTAPRARPGATFAAPTLALPIGPMTTQYFDYAATGAFSALVTDYLAQAPHLAPFYHRYPTLANFADQLREKAAAYPATQRVTLATEVRRQYLEQLGTPIHPAVVANLDLLAQPNTFTVTTGHQLSLMSGPLYFVYKIVSTIKLAQQLQEAYPEYRFVPIFWMATEDHDLPEIDHFSAFGQKFRWETNQHGATGRMRVDDGLCRLLDTLPEHFPALEAAYRDGATLADATRRLVHELFGSLGLVALDADVPVLKTALRPVIESELSGPAVQKAVHTANEELAAWYKPQIYARPINLFYLEDGLRERLERLDDGTIQVLNTNRIFTEAELRALAAAHPERFSPNVVLRPVYQELLLPNLAYIGGGAEVAYWLQLKGVFDLLHVPFPIVMLRNSAMYLPRAAAKKLRQLGLTPLELFGDFTTLKRRVAALLGDESLTLADEQARVAAVFADLHQLASGIDATLEKTVAAEAHRTAQRLDHLRQRLQKARDRRHTTSFERLETLLDQLFPGGTLQERVESVLSLLPGNATLVHDLLMAFDPLGNQFTVLLEE